VKTRSWIWQFDTDYPGVEPDDSKLPIGEVFVKTHDGVSYMSAFCDHPATPKNAASVAHLNSVYANQGIMFSPWCVPKGLNPAAEAAIAIEVIRAGSNRLILDVEPYQYFWTGPWANLHPYMQMIRAACPDAWISLSCDPRYGTYGHYTVDHLAEIHIDEWLPYINCLVPQDYWNTFDTDPVWEVEHTWERLKDYGKTIIFALPGHDDDPVRFQRGLERATQLAGAQDPMGWGGTSIWRRGETRRANWDAITQVDPGVLIETCEQKLAKQSEELLATYGRLRGASDQIANLQRLMDAANEQVARLQATADARLGRIRGMESKVGNQTVKLQEVIKSLSVGIPYSD